jgi:hypothetical protein
VEIDRYRSDSRHREIEFGQFAAEVADKRREHASHARIDVEPELVLARDLG